MLPVLICPELKFYTQLQSASLCNQQEDKTEVLKKYVHKSVYSAL